MALEYVGGEELSRLRVHVALTILREIAPELLNNGEFIGYRLALAYTWYRFLCYSGRCPKNIPGDMRKWDDKTITTIAEELVKYARDLLKDAIK